MSPYNNTLANTSSGYVQLFQNQIGQNHYINLSLSLLHCFISLSISLFFWFTSMLFCSCAVIYLANCRLVCIFEKLWFGIQNGFVVCHYLFPCWFSLSFSRSRSILLSPFLSLTLFRLVLQMNHYGSQLQTTILIGFCNLWKSRTTPIPFCSTSNYFRSFHNFEREREGEKEVDRKRERNSTRLTL